MPELPEVEVVRQALIRTLVGRRILHYRGSGKKLRKPVPVKKIQDQLIGSLVTAVERRARYLLIRLNNGSLLIFHLGMTGKLGIFSRSHPARPHDHLCFQLDNGKELRFNDVRRFGFVEVLSPDEAAKSDPFAGLGREPLGEEISAAYLEGKARGKSKPIKNFLMDNAIVVGIGNIYVNEILFASGIHPAAPAGSLSRRQWEKIIRQSRIILQRAIDRGGTTIIDFESESGKPGYFQLELGVYGKAGQPCPRCRTPIKRQLMSGRATFFCEHCQK
jgi:formamidopyrimidine-DNA glycosylase